MLVASQRKSEYKEYSSLYCLQFFLLVPEDSKVCKLMKDCCTYLAKDLNFSFCLHSLVKQSSESVIGRGCSLVGTSVRNSVFKMCQ